MVSQKPLRQIVETKYLSQDKTPVYREIIHYFYSQHERYRNRIFPEEIFENLQQNAFFSEYCMEELQRDLDSLVRWGNLTEHQETGNCRTIEQFKSRRYGYQCTPYTIEIERMIKKLEKLDIGFGGSLEKTLWDRLLESLFKVIHEQEVEGELSYTLHAISDEQLNLYWNDLFEIFRKLTNNAQDYLGHLQNLKVHQALLGESLLVQKDKMVEYLRNFIIAFQYFCPKVKYILKNIPDQLQNELIDRLTRYQMSIPRLDELLSNYKIHEHFTEQWNNFNIWFKGNSQRESEYQFLHNETSEAIRRLTRQIQRMSENRNNLSSRKSEYLHLAYWFNQIDEVREAHTLSAAVFGVFQPRHFHVLNPKSTEDVYARIWDEEVSHFSIKPKTVTFRERTKPSPMPDLAQKKEERKREYLLERERESRMIDELIQKSRIAISELYIVDPYIRRTFLRWIERCKSHPKRIGKTDTGHRVQLLELDHSRVTLVCEDGILEMPDYTFQFIDHKGDENEAISGL